MANTSYGPTGQVNYYYLSILITLLACLSYALGYFQQPKPKRTLFIHISGHKEKSENSNGSKQIFVSGTGKQLPEIVSKHKGRVHINLGDDQTDVRNGFKFGWSLLIFAILIMVAFSVLKLGIFIPAAEQFQNYQCEDVMGEMPQTIEAIEDTHTYTSEDANSDTAKDAYSNTETEPEGTIWSAGAMKWLMNSISLELNFNLKAVSS